jgi:hypothetical protein
MDHLHKLAALHDKGWDWALAASTEALNHVGGSPEFKDALDRWAAYSQARDVVWREYLTMVWREACGL